VSGWTGRNAAALTAIFTAAFVLDGCATRPADPQELAYYQERNDPFEPMNRVVFQFNEVVDKVVLRPVSIGYRAVVPSGIRWGIHNFLDNLTKPLTIANALLQGEGVIARDATGRFMTNTILGLGGFIDIASDAGIPQQDEDFGQTLAVWGVAPGPYVVLPLLGPSNLRDAVGRGTDSLTDPFGRMGPQDYRDEALLARWTLDAVDWRSANIETIDEVRRNSLDFYATARSAYRQRRANEIANGRGGPGDGLDGLPPMVDFDSMDLPAESGNAPEIQQ